MDKTGIFLGILKVDITTNKKWEQHNSTLASTGLTFNRQVYVLHNQNLIPRFFR